MEEVNSFNENETWELTDPPTDKTVVECKWVFKVKCDSENKSSYRARLVAKGYTQKEGIDYVETFAPVVRHSTLRLLIGLAVKLNFCVFEWRIKRGCIHATARGFCFKRKYE